MVVKINEGGCSPSCCGEPMVELKANDTDGAKEKHVPDVAVEDGVIKVKVGSVEHPMLDAHYITMIALETEKGVQAKFLKPGEAPAAEFTHTSIATCTASGRKTSEAALLHSPALQKTSDLTSGNPCDGLREAGGSLLCRNTANTAVSGS